jgi:gliding motility-associated-like protein
VGLHTIKLVVTDINGCKDSITTQIDIQSLDIDFNFTQDVCDPLTVQFEGISSIAANPYWDFGDGNFITGVVNTSHTYAVTGYYNVRYSIGNGACTDTLEKTIAIDIIRDNIILTTDTTICYGTTKQLLTVPSLSFCWTPVTYLNDPGSPSPITSATNDITYYFTAKVTGDNLIVNGDFSQGNSGFTSQYNHANPNITEGQYFVGFNPRLWNGSLSNCTDHTSGNGNMMMINGSPFADMYVWQQTITVTPNTNYAFSTWIEALDILNPAQLRFSINGKNVGNMITASQSHCTWTQFFTTWNSGNTTTAVIAIVNKNTVRAGNDFALDDISFAPVFIKRDSVIISVENPVIQSNNDTIVCTQSPVQLTATGAQGYTWAPATGLNNVNIGNPVAAPIGSTQYIVTGTTSNGCIAKDTVNVNVFTIPAITTTPDAIICKNSSIQLLATGGNTYSWSPGATLSNPAISNPFASPLVNTLYYVAITDGNNCNYLDSVQVNIQSDPFFSTSPASQICLYDSLQLNASGGNVYAWQPAAGLSNASIPNPKAWPSSTTNYTVTITETVCSQSVTLSVPVTVRPLPDVRAFRSADLDCSNDRSQLNATGANLYSWSPASTLTNPRIDNPIARPVTTTQYVVAGTDAAGCTNYDSVIVKVDNINKGGYLMPNAFTPNGDGLNDCYGIDYWGIIEEVEFSIFNRWGERIFFTKDPRKCWDGTYKGIKQDGNVFVYMVKAKTSCEPSVFRKGTFVLIR